jgi:pyruvate formate lyase activating enzyme
LPELNRPSKNGIVFNIQRYSLHDGPGIRTVVFLKGCPLRCQWCCNPESFVLIPQISFSGSKCIQCERCFEICPVAITPDQRIQLGGNVECIFCGACIEECPTGALEIIGREMTVDEVLLETEMDRLFYESSGGGVTLSGGEVLFQWQFAAELLAALKSRHIHTVIETSGFGKWEHMRRILDYTDLLLFDIKHMDTIKHREVTGVYNERILTNAMEAAKNGINMIFRVPLIPKINDDQENIQKIAEFSNRIGVKEIHLLPYHKLGITKYEKLRCNYSFSANIPEANHVLQLRDVLKSSGLIVKTPEG